MKTTLIPSTPLRNTKSVIDARRLCPKSKKDLRLKCVLLVIQESMHPELVSQICGVSSRSVYNWIRLYKLDELNTLKNSKTLTQGNPLTHAQIADLFASISLHNPTEFGINSILWTVDIILDFINSKFSIVMSRTSCWRLLKKIGLSVQKPIRKAYEQNKEAVQFWCDNSFVEASKKAKLENKTLVWMDEATVQSASQYGTTWGKIGLTPIIPEKLLPYKAKLIGSIDQFGQTHMCIYEGRVDSSVICNYIKALMESRKDSIVLILDNAAIHKSSMVKKFVEDNYKDRLELFYLPPYSPELNPVELLWANIKSKKLHKYFFNSLNEFQTELNECCSSIMKTDFWAIDFFKKESLQYIRRANDLTDVHTQRAA